MPFTDLKPATLAVIPRGRVGDPGAAGAPGDQISFNTLADAVATNIDPAVHHFRTGGYGAAGDGGDELYYRLGATPVPAKAWHAQTADGGWWEIANYQLNLLAIGGKGDDATNNDTAFAAWADAIDHGWSLLRLPYGKYRCSRFDLSGKSDFRIVGDGGIDKNHTGKGSTIIITRTDNAAGIKARNCKGGMFEHIGITWAGVGFTGILLDISCDVSGDNALSFSYVHFYRYGGAAPYTALTCVYGKNCCNVLFTGCQFSHCNYGAVATIGSDSSAATGVWTFNKCWFIYLNAAYVNPGLTWHFGACHFEPSPTGAPAGGFSIAPNYFEAVNHDGCTCADATAPGIWFDTTNWFGGGFINGSIGGDTDVSGDVVTGIRADHIFGASFNGNLWSGVTNGIILNGPFLSEFTCTGGSWPNATTAIGNPQFMDRSCNVSDGNSMPGIYPRRLQSVALAQLPNATTFAGGIVTVPDATGGECVAIASGGSWKKVALGATVS